MIVYFYKDFVFHECIAGGNTYEYKNSGECIYHSCSFSIPPSILINLFDYRTINKKYLFPPAYYYKDMDTMNGYYKERVDITKLVEELRNQ